MVCFVCFYLRVLADEEQWIIWFWQQQATAAVSGGSDEGKDDGKDDSNDDGNDERNDNSGDDSSDNSDDGSNDEEVSEADDDIMQPC
jgi:hypothetical protein